MHTIRNKVRSRAVESKELEEQAQPEMGGAVLKVLWFFLVSFTIFVASETSICSYKGALEISRLGLCRMHPEPFKAGADVCTYAAQV
jgi:hypothetical protein